MPSQAYTARRFFSPSQTVRYVCYNFAGSHSVTCTSTYQSSPKRVAASGFLQNEAVSGNYTKHQAYNYRC